MGAIRGTGWTPPALDTTSAEAFYACTAPLFVPDGPGRVVLVLGDEEIAAIKRLPVDIMFAGDRYAKDGALFVVPTPAGVVAVRRRPQPHLEQLFPEGRHDRGWAPKPDWRSKLAEMRRKAPFLTA